MVGGSGGGGGGAGETGSKRAVYAALFGNLAIAISKLFAALFTGSTAMWAETYHSFSDTFNQVLLLVGIKESKKKASENYPFGYGKEQFFWSFIVATLIFGVSGVLSLEQGISSLIGHDPHELENTWINYIILAIAFIFEVNALRIAFASFRKTIEGRGKKLSFFVLLSELKQNKDPIILTVIVEDSAALLGIMIAAIGLALSDITGNMFYDAVGSVIIGLVLMVFAFFLARENKGMLIGEAISKSDYKKIYDIVSRIPEVRKVISIRTMHFAPQDVLIAIELSLIDNLDTDTIENVIDNIEAKIKQAISYVASSKVYVELERQEM